MRTMAPVLHGEMLRGVSSHVIWIHNRLACRDICTSIRKISP
jgi:hypothetical protein